MQHAVLALLTAATPTPSPSGASTPSPTLTNPLTDLGTRTTEAASNVVCSRDDFSICGLVLRATGNKTLGQFLQVLLGTPLQIVVTIMLGLLARRLLHRVIDRLVERIARSRNGGGLSELSDRISERLTERAGAHEDSADDEHHRPPPIAPETVATRREARARTLASVLRSVTTAVIGTIVLLSVLQELTLPIASLLASVGVVGVALGFGCQSLVRDVVSGLFMIVEDQYGVGDWIDVGQATGRVEAVSLRVSRLRDVDGTVWYVRNGEIQRVGNRSQGWSRVVLDIPVAYGENLDRVQDVLRSVATAFWSDPDRRGLVTAEPEVWGVEKLTSEAVFIRVVARTPPPQQWQAARELRAALKTGLEDAGVLLAAQPWAIAPGGGSGHAPTPAAEAGPNGAAGREAEPAPGPPEGERDSEDRRRARSRDPMGS